MIEQLTMQAKKAIQAIYDSRNSQKPVSAKKLLFLYNRINRKLSQIECLTANSKSCRPGLALAGY
ncbi:MAG: hypothetical protein ACLS8R_10065 [Anaeromassilibacillus sp.]